MNVIEYKKTIAAGILVFSGVFIAYVSTQGIANERDEILPDVVPSCESFPRELDLEEAESISASGDACWWVDSGASFSVRGGIGQTLMGPIYPGSRWRQLYASSNPVDTENGLYPQNIFRLINTVPRQDFREEVFFNIKSYNANESPNRNASNGIVLFGRYVNDDNLYYAGVRVDGTAIIKRKLNGVYETLGIVTLDNSTDYDRAKNPNMLPVGEWIGLALNIKNEPDAPQIMIQLSMYVHDTWQTMLAVIDDPTRLQNGAILLRAGNTGIRTDFMDAEFKDYKITDISS